MLLTNDPDNWIKNLEETHAADIQFCKDRLSTEGYVQAGKLVEVIPCFVTSEQNYMLMLMPTTEEVKDAIFSICVNSALGPDGLTTFFYQHYWDIVALDVHQAVILFFKGVVIPSSFLHNFIYIIPKKR